MSLFKIYKMLYKSDGKAASDVDLTIIDFFEGVDMVDGEDIDYEAREQGGKQGSHFGLADEP